MAVFRQDFSKHDADSLELLHRMSKPDKDGKRHPVDIIDSIMAEVIKEEHHFFALYGTFYHYQDGVYRKDEAGSYTKTLIGTYIYDHLRDINRINRVFKLLLSDSTLEKQPEDLNQYPVHWINFQNVMLDVKELKAYGHDPKYYSINQIPHRFMGTMEHKIKGSATYRFLWSLIKSNDDRTMFLEYTGYCFTRDTHLQKFMIIFGPGGIGKSVLLSLVSYAIGADNISGISLQGMNERFTTAYLQGKLANICGDLPSTAMEAADGVKLVTGGDQVKGEIKGGRIFFFTPYAKLLFSANRIPINRDDNSNAFYRRLLILRLTSRGEWIEDIENKLKEEIDLFIWLCVDALHKMYKNGGGGTFSESCGREVAELYRQTDPVRAFLYDRMIDAPERMVERKKLYAAYCDYCRQEQRPETSRNGFFSNLREKGYGEKKIRGERFFTGLDFKPADWIATDLSWKDFD